MLVNVGWRADMSIAGHLGFEQKLGLAACRWHGTGCKIHSSSENDNWHGS